MTYFLLAHQKSSCAHLSRTRTRPASFSGTGAHVASYLLCIRDSAHRTLRPALHPYWVSLRSLWHIWLPWIPVALLLPCLRSLLLCVGVASSVRLRPHLPHLIHWAGWLGKKRAQDWSADHSVASQTARVKRKASLAPRPQKQKVKAAMEELSLLKGTASQSKFTVL